MNKSHHNERFKFKQLFTPLVLDKLPVRHTVRNITIPRRIMQFWDKDTPSDVQVLLAMNEAWADRHNVIYDFFDETAALKYLSQKVVNGYALSDVFKACFHPAMKADFFRLAYLFDLGGLYIDADNVVADQADTVFSYDRDLVFLNVWLMRIRNGYIAVGQRSKLIEMCLKQAVLNVMTLAKTEKRIAILTGPYLFTSQLHSLLQNDNDYKVYIVKSTKNTGFYRDATDVLDKKLKYKNTDMNWQIAQEKPLVEKFLIEFRADPSKLGSYRKVGSKSLKFGIDLEGLISVSEVHLSSILLNGNCMDIFIRALLRCKKHQRAIEVLEQAIKAGNRNPALLCHLANMNMGPARVKFDEALDLAEEAYTKAPEEIEPILAYARILVKKNQHEESLNIMKKGLLNHPNNTKLINFYNQQLSAVECS